MNEEDLDLERWMAPARCVEPNADARAANRRAVAGALAATPWWRRSIAVPVPVALATAAALLFMAINPMRQEGAPPVEKGGPAESRVVDEAPRLAPAGPGYARSETHQYYPGVGVVNRLVVYQPEDSR